MSGPLRPSSAFSPLKGKIRQFSRAVFFSPSSIRFQACCLGLLSRATRRRAPAVARHRERIVVVKLDRIGDFVLATAFLRELRRNFPESWITLVVSEIAGPLASHCPHVNEVLITPRPPPGLRGGLRQWRDWLALAWRHLIPLRATLAILPRWDVDLYEAFALLALTEARRRVSYSTQVTSEKARRNRGADCLLTDAIAFSPHLHEVERNLDLLTNLGLPVTDARIELWPAADITALVARFLPGRADHFLVALCPISAEEAKDWPFTRFLEVVRQFTGRDRVTFVLFAGPDCAGLSQDPQACALPNLVVLAGQLSLDETSALLAHCGLVLTVDTGLAHIAAALRRPIVLVGRSAGTGDTNNHYSPARFGPWQADCTLVTPLEPSNALRSIDAVTVDQVAAAVSVRLPAG